jgi:hypothetical protein
MARISRESEAVLRASCDDNERETTMGHAKDGSLQCDGWCKQTGAVTHIDEKGYAYCTPCGIQRKASHRCRKLTGAEIKRLQAGLTISYERPRKVECYRCQAKHPASEGGYCATCRQAQILTWAWGEDRFSDGYSLGAVAEAIAESVVQDLDNGKAGTVTGPDGVEYQINVSVTLTPVKRRRERPTC